jgi:hypothetical protein
MTGFVVKDLPLRRSRQSNEGDDVCQNEASNGKSGSRYAPEDSRRHTVGALYTEWQQ